MRGKINVAQIQTLANESEEAQDFYIYEESGQIDLTSSWKQLAVTEDGAIATYDVKYIATDPAGNVSDPYEAEINLTENPAVDTAGENPATLNLNGSKTVTAKVSQKYTDLGVTIVFDGETYAHVWNSGDLNLKVAKNGYSLTFNAYTVEDPEKAEGSVTRTVNVTALSPVEDFYLATGNKFIDLHWENPKDPEFLGVNIYRSTIPSEAGNPGTLLDRTSDGTHSYEDDDVVNGKTYYYVLKAIYAGPDGEDIESAATEELSATPTAPKLALETTSFGNDSENIAVEKPKGEVKSGNTNENKEEKNEDDGNTMSYFGIGLLVILVLVGIYLLYVQNPEWFDWIFFWKKKNGKK